MWSLFVVSMSLGSPPEVTAPTCAAGADRRVSREFRRLSRADQLDRIHWVEGMAARDAERRTRVHELAGHVCSPKDAFGVARILQHSPERPDFLEAHQLMRWAASEGHPEAPGWAALTWDRYLTSGGEPQWYGSQMQAIHDDTGATTWACLYPVDPAATDAERVALGRSTLAERIASIYAISGREAPVDLTMAQLEADGLVCEWH